MHRKYMSFPVFPWVCNSHLARVYYLTGPFIRFGIVGGGGGRWPITISSVVVVEFSQAFSRVPREVMAKVAALSHCTAAFVSSSFKRVVGIGTSTTDRQSRDWPQNGQTGHTHTHTHTRPCLSLSISLIFPSLLFLWNENTNNAQCQQGRARTRQCQNAISAVGQLCPYCAMPPFVGQQKHYATVYE